MPRITQIASSTLLCLGLALGSLAAQAGDIHVRDAWMPAYGEKPDSAPAFLTLINLGATEDRLIGARSEGAREVSLRTLRLDDGELRTVPLQAVSLPPGVPVVFESGLAWLMLEGFNTPLAARGTQTITLIFERAGEVEHRIRIRNVQPGGGSLDNMRTDPLQSPGQTQRTEGLDDALRSDPFLR